MNILMYILYLFFFMHSHKPKIFGRSKIFKKKPPAQRLQPPFLKPLKEHPGFLWKKMFFLIPTFSDFFQKNIFFQIEKSFLKMKNQYFSMILFLKFIYSTSAFQRTRSQLPTPKTWWVLYFRKNIFFALFDIKPTKWLPTSWIHCAIGAWWIRTQRSRNRPSNVSGHESYTTKT